MKIEIELTERKRATLDNAVVADPDFPADLNATRILYDVHVAGRRTLEFAIIVPHHAADCIPEETFQSLAEDRFRRTLEQSIYNEALARRVDDDLEESRRKAIDALSRYKFQMFGYWAAIWVHLNRIKGTNEANPFRGFVRLAKRAMAATVEL